LIIAGLLFAGAAGCVQSTSTPPHHSNLQPGDLPETPSSKGQPVSPEQLTRKDACPARLHEIEGALLEYWVDHHQLPPALTDLHAVEPNLELTCPDSHQPYVYVPAGLRKPDAKGRIIVHDPVRNADRTWWCIMFIDAPAGKSIQTFVEQLSDPLFRGYQ
jgi:hypothetical protein